MTLQICRMPRVTASTLPDTVTSRSVELGSMSPEIWIDAPATYIDTRTGWSIQYMYIGT